MDIHTHKGVDWTNMVRTMMKPTEIVVVIGEFKETNYFFDLNRHKY